MKMKNFIDSFKDYSHKQLLKEDKSQISIRVLLVIDRKADRYKEDILSDIRATTGVTIITTEEQKNVKNLDYNIITLKLDTDPFNTESVIRNLLQIRKDILSIRGVVRFKYISRPEVMKRNA